jgi:hypothetical protein
VKRRIVGIAALAATAAVALGLSAAGVAAPPGDAHGPPCSDIFLVEPNYTGTVGGTGRVFGTLTTPRAISCVGGVYTVNVYDASGTTLLGSQTFTGGTTDEFSYDITFADAPQVVCVFATSTVRGRITDTAPDDACDSPDAQREIGTGGGASGFG